MNQRPYAYDLDYLARQVALGQEVNVDGKSYKNGGAALPSQAELDSLMKRDGMEPKSLAPIDPLVPHGEPNQTTPAELAKRAPAKVAFTQADFDAYVAANPGAVTALTDKAVADALAQQSANSSGNGTSGDPPASETYAGFPLEHFKGMSNAQLLKVDGVDEAIVAKIRAAQQAAKR